MTSNTGLGSIPRHRSWVPPKCPGCGAYMKLGQEIVEKPLRYEPQVNFRAWYACVNCGVWRTNTFYGPTMELAVENAYKSTQERTR